MVYLAGSEPVLAYEGFNLVWQGFWRPGEIIAFQNTVNRRTPFRALLFFLGSFHESRDITLPLWQRLLQSPSYS